MSLQMNAFITDESGRYQQVGDSLLAGFQIYVEKFWGAAIMKELGLKILPQMSEFHAVWVMNDELDDLEAEANIILNSRELIGDTLGMDAFQVAIYANNVLKCMQVAREVNGGIVID